MRENKETKLEPFHNLALTLALITTWPLTFLYHLDDKKGFGEMLLFSLGFGLFFGMARIGERLNAVPLSWIKLSWVLTGALTALMSVLITFGVIFTEDVASTLFVFIYACVCAIALLSLLFQWLRHGVIVAIPALWVFVFFFLFSLMLYMYKASHFLLIGFAQSMYLVACLTGQLKNGLCEDAELTDPLIPKLIASCAMGLMLMSGLFHFFRDELITKKGSFMVLQSLPPVICLLTYWGIRAIRPYEKPPE